MEETEAEHDGEPLTHEESVQVEKSIESFMKAVDECVAVVNRIGIDPCEFSDHLVELLQARFNGEDLARQAVMSLLLYSGDKDIAALRSQLLAWIDKAIDRLTEVNDSGSRRAD